MVADTGAFMDAIKINGAAVVGLGDGGITPAQLARISAPTLIMAGDDDMIPVSHAVETWASIPHAKLCVVPDAGHFWLKEKPELANQIILDFLLKSD